MQNHFVDAYYPTIESTFAKSVKYKGVDYECHIIDTAGQVRCLSQCFACSLHTSRMNIHPLTHNMPLVSMAMSLYIQSRHGVLLI